MPSDPQAAITTLRKDAEAVLERHIPYAQMMGWEPSPIEPTGPTDTDYCSRCMVEMPCDAYTQASRLLKLLGAIDALESELSRLHSWDGLIELLDEHWPADIFNGSSGDPGPTIVALIRVIDGLNIDLAAALDTLETAMKALRWYANSDDYWHDGESYGDYTCPVLRDGGKRARAALSAIEEAERG